MNNEQKAADTLKWFAWAANLIGVVLFLLNVSDFRADNLGLMTAIGFLIAGMNILLLSTVFRLLHVNN